MPNSPMLAGWQQRWNRSLLRFLGRRVRSAVDIEDLAQETYLRLLRARDLGEVRNPQAYLLRVASHVLVEWRGHELRPESLVELDDDLLGGVGVPQRGVNVAASLAWTRRQLMFEHRPLSEVAEEFNRYNRDRIDIDSAELKRQEVTGVFEANDPASFLAFLSSIPGVEIREGANGTHIVSLRSPMRLPDTRRAPQ